MKKWEDVYSDAFIKVLGPDGYKPSTDESIEIAKQCYNQAIYDAWKDVKSRLKYHQYEKYAKSLLKLKYE